MNLSFNRYLQPLFSLLLLMASVKFLMLVLFSFLPKEGVDHLNEPDVEMPYARYAFADLMGGRKARGNVAVTPVKGESIPTMKGVRLVGFYRENDTKGWVIVETGNGQKTQILSVGESVNGFKLVKILEDMAVFERGGRLYKLAFKKAKYDYSVQPVEHSPAEEPVRAVPKKAVRYYAKHFGEIWKEIGIRDYVRHGKIQGFRVTHVKKGSIFEKLGLEKGDIIVSVNGKPMKSYKQAFDLYKKIDKIRSLKITVERNGKKRDLEYEIY